MWRRVAISRNLLGTHPNLRAVGRLAAFFAVRFRFSAVAAYFQQMHEEPAIFREDAEAMPSGETSPSAATATRRGAKALDAATQEIKVACTRRLKRANIERDGWPSRPIRQAREGEVDAVGASQHLIRTLDRRRFLQSAGTVGGMLATLPAWADAYIDLDLPGGPDRRELTTAFPQKGPMILQRTRPPLLETPFEVFDRGVFTPNDRFFVRWHWAVIPERVDVAEFKITVRGHVNRVLSLSMADVLTMPRVELAAVNQCSGNSRGFFQPRVAGGEWQNGAMGNARWTGVRLRDVLDRAGVKAGAVAVRFNGLDEPVVLGAPDFMKSLDIEHARDGEVMLAYQMNGAQLPLLNGFPIRLVVPGWYATYWVKMLNDIEVLDAPDENYWMKTAYRIPDTPHASVKPGETGFKTVPINRLVPRSFFTNLTNMTTVKPGAVVPVRGIAFGGDCGVSRVELSADGGRGWRKVALGRDEGTYSFRQWRTEIRAPRSGALTLQVRCTNTKGEVQSAEPNWNAGGFMRNVIESVRLRIA